MSDSIKRILVVDDDEKLLQGIMRAHRKSYDLTTACGGPEGLHAVENDGPFAVVVSDYQMPKMNGITFLSRVREIHPDTVRVMLTGNADYQTAIDAVNRGQIFRFLSKPCSHEVFRAGMNLALEQYRLIDAERTLLEKTLRGSVKVLVDILSMVHPDAFGRAVRVKGFVQQLAEHLDLPDSWRYETAALLSQIGCVALPQEVLEKAATGEELSEEQERMLQRHPATARDLLANIPRLEEIAEMIGAQDDRFVDDAQGKTIPFGAKILKVSLDFDRLVHGGASAAEAAYVLRGRRDWYDPSLLPFLDKLHKPGEDAVVRTVAVEQLRTGMLLDEDVLNEGGGLVVRRGQEITGGMLERLRNYAHLGSIPDEIRVRVSTDLVPEVSAHA